MPLSSTVAFIATILLAQAAFAGPPFLTDDPDPVPYQHWEFYTFISRDRQGGFSATSGPAIEVNNGVAPNTQLHLVISEARVSSTSGPSETGLGDTETGVKYRLLKEAKSRPEIGIFPMAELSTGNANKGLGNGKTWYRMPVWLEKNWGSWTTYGGGGYVFNPEPGQRDYTFAGDLLQKTISPALSVGGEIFLQGATADNGIGGAAMPGSAPTALWNVGGQYNVTPDFSLLFSAGRSFYGDGNRVLYIGLYRTWGPGSP
jgi:hypothetical protein